LTTELLVLRKHPKGVISGYLYTGYGRGVAGLLLSSAPAYASNTPLGYWSVPGPGSGVTELSFYQQINAATTHPEWYFANQFGFTGGGDIGYTGLQPVENYPSGGRQLAPSQVAWVERYTGPPFPPCNASALSHYEVKFFNRTANNGALNGSIGDFSQSTPACPGETNSAHDSTGTTVTGGYQ
jgi:hypothetical protein